MVRHKSVLGTCHLCGEKKKLSFEHIPPKSTYNNKGTYYEISMEDYIKVKNPLKDKPNGKLKQGGIGVNSLCRDCNSFLGINYVEPYRKWVNSGIELLNMGDGQNVVYEVLEVEPLRIMKQIISMFLSINDENFSERYPELRGFVLNTESQDLPDKFKLFTYLNNEGEVRYLNEMGWGNILQGSFVLCSEITFPPYGFVLVTKQNGNLDERLTNITDFKKFKLDQKGNLKMMMSLLPTYFQTPFDYRSKDELEGIFGD